MKTAVEWLEERRQCDYITWEDIQQAKEMEKQQMIDFGINCIRNESFNFDVEQYYNETFKTNDK